MTATVALRLLDTSVRLDVVGAGAADVASAIGSSWVRCLGSESDEADVTLTVTTDPTAAGADLTGPDVATLLHYLSPTVTLRAIDHQAGRLLMLHAAGLAEAGSGRTIALVAPSGTGKTTAASRLARQWGYVTDETVAVRPDGSIAIYPKPLSVAEAASAPLKRQLSPDELGLLAAPRECVLSGIAFLARDGSSEPWVEEVPLLEALAMLAAESSYLARFDRPLRRLADVIGAAGGLKVLHYAESDQLAALVEDVWGLAS